MDMREAFETEMKRIGMSVYKIGSEYQSVQDAWIAWQAACEWQKQKDADLANDLWFWSENPDIQTYDKDVGDCIRNHDE